MRWLFVVLAGCGRLGFDLLGDDTNPPADAAPDAPPFVCDPIGNDDDADDIDDACDVCPHISGPQEDRDGDRVGDACDPNPLDPKDHIVLFDAFEKVDPRWTFSNGSSIVNSSLVIDALGTNWAGSYAMTPANDRFVLGGKLGVRGNAPPQIFSLLMFQGPGKYHCQIYDDATQTRHELADTLDGQNFNTQGTIVLPGRVDNKDFTMTLVNSRPNVKCASVAGMDLTAMGTVSAQHMPTIVAINVVDRTVELRYFLQIRTD